jgi:hypothetical protein
MKKIIVLCLFCFQLIAFARIGETPNQCQKRYGYAISEQKMSNELVKRIYKKDKIHITIYFYKNIAAKIVYQKEMVNFSNPPLDSQEIMTLLNANSQGNSWEKMDLIKKAYNTKDELKSKDYIRMAVKGIWWIRSDNFVIALYRNHYDELIIESENFPQTQDDTLDGF